MPRSFARSRLTAGLTIALLVAACGGGAAATPTPAAPTVAPATVAPATVAPASVAPATVAPTAAAPTQPITGAPSLDAVDQIEAGMAFDVAWIGPNGQRDYVALMAPDAGNWTREPYFGTVFGSPGKLTAPSAPGPYELRYIDGVTLEVLARRPLLVTPFSGSLLAPDSIMANSQFDVAWNGPDGPGDYVTIVKAGATKWSNEDYFNTTEGTPSKLLASLEPGSYEIWYVIGADDSVQSRRPITVTPVAITLDAQDSVNKLATFPVTWTGPDGTGDYTTIVKSGAGAGEDLSYFYTMNGSPGTLLAPNEPGDYEIRYIPGQLDVVLATIPIRVN